MWEVPRKHQRVPVLFEVVLEATSGKHDARMSDISMGGCYIDTIGHVSTGEAVVFKVNLPTGHWVQLRGEVVHHLPNVGVGLRFAHLSEEEEILIEQVVLAQGGEVTARRSEPREADEKSRKRNTAARRVLVADDDPMIRHLVTVIAQKEGYVVVAARDGQEVYNILQTDNDFVAAIFDMMMPHIDGLDLVRYVRTEQRLMSIPVGIVTAEQNPKLWRDSFDAGAGIFLPKPFTTEQLKFMLRVLVSEAEA
ncbi:MAG: response regulator [Pyrinomonadaceae bacterium]|nr:response regulator [Pyrinomonadaceae bacterium]